MGRLKGTIRVYAVTTLLMYSLALTPPLQHLQHPHIQMSATTVASSSSIDVPGGSKYSRVLHLNYVYFADWELI